MGCPKTYQKFEARSYLQVGKKSKMARLAWCAEIQFLQYFINCEPNMKDKAMKLCGNIDPLGCYS
jgi:hypothetical protein